MPGRPFEGEQLVQAFLPLLLHMAQPRPQELRAAAGLAVPLAPPMAAEPTNCFRRPRGPAPGHDKAELESFTWKATRPPPQNTPQAFRKRLRADLAVDTGATTV
eukprot:2753610-Pyramimonas_sp.AAC.1